MLAYLWFVFICSCDSFAYFILFYFLLSCLLLRNVLATIPILLIFLSIGMVRLIGCTFRQHILAWKFEGFT